MPLITVLTYGLAVIALILTAVNAICMLVSPRAWFRLPYWLRAEGTLSQARFGRPTGLLFLRLAGGLILLSMAWLGRVLKGMKGRLWIDKATDQWVKVHAEVVKPVSFYGFLAKVGPGTEFDLKQAPVAGDVWMPQAFNVSVRASALGFFSENSDESDTYRDYQPMPQASALLQSTK